MVLAGCGGAGDDEAARRAPPAATGSAAARTVTVPAPAEDGTAGEAAGEEPDQPGELVVEVLERIPRRGDAFTQGLEIDGGRLYESVGLYGASALRILDPDTLEVRAETPLDAEVFAEGLTVVGDRVVVLTWQEGRVLVHDATDLAPVDELSIAHDGWGLCEIRPGVVVHSDGTSTLRVRDVDDFSVTDEVTVTLDGVALDGLNELECVEGTVWANVWLTDRIVAIDPSTGVVTATVDASGLVVPHPAERDPDAVLNGIAHLGDGRFLVTGKRWPSAAVVRFVADADPDPG